MLEKLIQFDYQLFQLINSEWSNAFFDMMLPLMRDKLFWIPFYCFIIIYFIFRFNKKSILLIAFWLLTILISDTLSSRIIKKTVQRTRPCKNLTLEEPAIHRIKSCAGFSFTSSHACNHFAMALFLGLIFSRKRKRRFILDLFIIWAVIISYAQVYVGVHYPIDVMVGGILGSIIGISTFYIMELYFYKNQPSTKSID